MEYNLVKLEELTRVIKAEDDDLLLLSSGASGAYQSTHMTFRDAFNSFNIRLNTAQRNSFASFRDTSCIDLEINEDTLRTQEDANQAILDIFRTFGNHICDLELGAAGSTDISYQPTPPSTNLNTGDLWVNSDDENLLVWDGTDWVPISSAGSVVLGLSKPDEPKVGDLWVDVEDFGMYVWEGDAWVQLNGSGSSSQGASTLSLSPPADPVAGDMWTDVNDYKIYTWSGFAWVQVA